MQIIDGEQFRSVSSIDTNRLMEAMNPAFERVGAIADGISQLVVLVRLPRDFPEDRVTVTLRDARSGAAPLGGLPEANLLGVRSLTPPDLDTPVAAGLTQTDVPLRIASDGKWAVVIYQPPEEFDPVDLYAERLSHRVAFQVSSRGSTGASGAIRVDRRPLLLLHGLASRLDTFKDIIPILRTLYPEVDHQRVDYSHRNTDGFDGIFRAIPQGIRDLLARVMADKRVAAKSVDVFAHSMGGLATQWYISPINVSETRRRCHDGRWLNPINLLRDAGTVFLRPDNYMRGDIRRVVTIGTPYLGSAVAYGVSDRYTNGAMQAILPTRRHAHTRYNFLGLTGNGAAFEDLQPNSAAFTELRQASPRTPRVC